AGVLGRVAAPRIVPADHARLVLGVCRSIPPHVFTPLVDVACTYRRPLGPVTQGFSPKGGTSNAQPSFARGSARVQPGRRGGPGSLRAPLPSPAGDRPSPFLP